MWSQSPSNVQNNVSNLTDVVIQSHSDITVDISKENIS